MATGYPRFQDVKHYLGIDNSGNDALIVATLKRAIATFENMCGRSFLPKTKTLTLDANDEQVVSPKRLFLRDGDLLTITELKIDGATVPTDEYYLVGTTPHFTVRITDASDFTFGEYSSTPEQTIEITGSWGFDTIVPEDVFGAIVRLTAFLYQQKDNAMELDRPIAMSNSMILPASLPSDVEAIAKFYKKVI
jgi:hypothetical protein